MTMQSLSLSRRWVLGALLASAGAPALARGLDTSPHPQPRPGAGSAGAGAGTGSPRVSSANVPVATAPQGEALVAAAKLGGAVSYVVAEAGSGRVLEARDADRAQPPASVCKTFTALYALDALGAGYRFTTRVLATGPLAAGIVQGDLILQGSGDPTLDTDTLGDMVRDLRAAGLRGVTGRFLFDAGALPQIDEIDPDQPDHVGYNPGIAGLNLNFNRVYFQWARAASGWQVTMDARGERFLPPVTREQMRIVDRDAPLYTYRGGADAELWTVASAALGKGGSRWLPVKRPDLYTAEVFRVLAGQQGIRLPAAETGSAAGTVLASHDSAPLGAVLREMLKWSTNLTAETVGLCASLARGGRVASLADSARRMTDWARQRWGITASFNDHSGLGSGTRVSAGDMVRVLLAEAGALRGLLKEVPIRDPEAGTDKKAPPLPVEVQAKTGTLNFVSGLAGYARCKGGADLVFAIFCADTGRRDALPMAQRERPEGGRAWTVRARTLEQQLLARWSAVYDV